MKDRYSRQMILPSIGEEGQRRLSRSFVVVVGCGALGSVIASSLVRAGVGRVRVIDRDFIEDHNLQRQVLFDEDDIKSELPKAIAAERHLRKINSSVQVEGIVADANHTNIEKLVAGADLIMDGLDNFEGRFLINDVSLKHGIPWVYGAAVGTSGMTMNIIPGETPCLRCLSVSAPSGAVVGTCDTAGVLGPAPFVVASLQSTEAIKILIGSEAVSHHLTVIDVWQGSFERFKAGRRPDCPACHGNYQSLDGEFGLETTALCGQNVVQVLGVGAGGISLPELAARLEPVVKKVSYNEHMLRFALEGDREMVVFPDGRALLRNTTDESLARALYAKYVGT
jgi:adenylyltransferase/sulfurtransferase